MKQPEHTVTHRTSTYPSNLITAAEAAEALKGVMGEERIVELADSGYAPHFRIDGGPPMFKISELRSWIADNLIAECAGKSVTDGIRLTYAGDEVADPFGVPESIRCISHLRDLSRLLTIGAGVYFLCLGSEVVYVGQSVDVASRISAHRGVKQFDRIYFLPWPAGRLNELEGALIRHLRPPLNVSERVSKKTGEIRDVIVAPSASGNAGELLSSLGFAANDNTETVTKKAA
ncbi:hypothetical protein KNLIENLN_00001 [Sinorhizobium phage NV1.1.1]|nr:hypothetical protein KNLIENLN_00001 [Sinorhizobium phage NV1.1.1]